MTTATKKTNWAAIILGGLATVNIGSLVTAWQLINSIATVGYVDEELEKVVLARDAQLQGHIATADRRIDTIETDLRRIRAFTEIVPQLKDLLKARCMGVRGLDTTIESLKREFREMTGEVYAEPPCDRLLP